MHYSVEITNDIYWLGINDRRKYRFENLWPLPHGVSYNSYLINDEKTALIDTIESGSDSSFIERIEGLLEERELDYLVINHMEPDHSGEIDSLVRRFPNITLVGNTKTFEILKNYYHKMSVNLLEVADGDALDLGKQQLQFIMTPWVHWPETMMTYVVDEQILFSGDAFGTFGTLDGGVLDKHIRFEEYEGEMRRYYSNIVGKYGTMVQRALKKFEDIPIKTICPVHGPVWQQYVSKVIALYDQWSKGEAEDAVVVIYASMYGNTGYLADYIANKLAHQGVTDIKVFDVSKTHMSYLISEIWKSRGVILGSCAYNTQMFPKMDALCTEMLNYRLKNRALSIFGSCSWSGGGVRNLKTFADESGWELVGEPVEMLGRPTPEIYMECNDLAKAMADKILNK